MVVKQVSKLKTLIVDDSALYRRFLRSVLKKIAAIEIVGSVSSGEIALHTIGLKPVDLVLLDIEMPGMNGLDVVKELKKTNSNAIIVFISGAHKNGADIVMEGLSNGVFDFIEKSTFATPDEARESLHSRLVTLVAAVFNHRNNIKGEAVDGITTTEVEHITRKFDIVLIASSTGGPRTLAKILPELPKDFPVPVLIVQHMPPVFTESLARTLDKASAIHVHEASSGELIVPGTVYVAPGGRHMEVKGTSQNFIQLSDAPAINGLKPAADITLKSMVEIYGSGILSVVLTGMGKDGLEGVRAVREAGGYCLAQDQATSVIYGMPKEVIEAGLANEIHSVGNMGKRITELITG